LVALFAQKLGNEISVQRVPMSALTLGDWLAVAVNLVEVPVGANVLEVVGVPVQAVNTTTVSVILTAHCRLTLPIILLFSLCTARLNGFAPPND
jgi:hypothetical protein